MLEHRPVKEGALLWLKSPFTPQGVKQKKILQKSEHWGFLSSPAAPHSSVDMLGLNHVTLLSKFPGLQLPVIG